MDRSLLWPRLSIAGQAPEGGSGATLTIEDLNKEVACGADLAGIFPNEDSTKRLVGAILLEQNDERQLQHRYITLETMANRVDQKLVSLTQIAA